ncbi:MAG: methyltransferase [Epsilonproteobacteria bacterium]|nr:methyltransferase [Campylobacterota bacterium]
MSNAMNEFSRFAHQYDQHNMIQAEVAKRLISGLSTNHYRNIIDLGCGSGAVYHNIQEQKISYDTFMALDSSKEMLAIHPNDEKIQKIHADFNTPEAYQHVSLKKEEATLFSASALQWSKDLDFVFSHLASLAREAHFAIFTSGTFHTLHLTAGIESPIYTKEQLQEVIECYYKATFTLQSYRLEFKTVRDMFRYIKKSGVSGGEKQLSYKQVKKLMEIYPLDYLEFEVLFVEATSLAS